jgi:transcriptional regulator with XRE-family HTH domain
MVGFVLRLGNNLFQWGGEDMPTALVRLLEERCAAGDSQRAIAKRANIGAATVGRIMDGADAKVSSVTALAPALGISEGEVLRLAATDADENEGDDLLNALILTLLARLPPDVKRQAVAILRILAGGNS